MNPEWPEDSDGDELDQDEWGDQPADTVDENIAAQHGGYSHRAEPHAPQGERDHEHDDDDTYYPCKTRFFGC